MALSTGNNNSFLGFLDKVNNLFAKVRPAFPDIPSILLLCTALKRPGLSELATTAKIITKMGADGLPISNAPDGSSNLMNVMVKDIVSGIFDAIRNDSKIQISHPIGSIQTTSFGGNAGGPIVVNGYNINMPKGYGDQK